MTRAATAAGEADEGESAGDTAARGAATRDPGAVASRAATWTARAAATRAAAAAGEVG